MTDGVLLKEIEKVRLREHSGLVHPYLKTGIGISIAVEVGLRGGRSHREVNLYLWLAS